MMARHRSIMLTALAATLMLAAPCAQAQTPAGKPGEPSRTVRLTMEQRHVIKEIILKEMKFAPTPNKVPTGVGQSMPTGVALQPIPVEVAAKIPAVRTFSFVVSDNTVLIVDPNSNKIAETIK